MYLAVLYLSTDMAQNPRRTGKYASGRHGTRASTIKGVSLKDHVGVPISGVPCISSGIAVNDIDIPVHIMTKEDIEEELSKIEERFGMTPEKFYEAWKNDEFHGFQAMKFGCLYEFYRDEFD